MPPTWPASWGALLQRRAAETPDALAYGFITDRGEVGATMTYAALATRAGALAAWLVERGARGERVLLLHPPGPDFVVALFGCFWAGAVAVPLPAPRPNRPTTRLDGVRADAGPLLELAGELPAAGEVAPVEGDRLAMLQYTSGSTGTPKGVMLRHAQLFHNAAAVYEGFGHDARSASLVWLPPFHDMGLIGGILQPMFGGFPGYLMSPLGFLKRPLAWLRALTVTGASTSGGPNFGYAMCTARAGSLEGLDLSRWRLAFNGAEPVRAATMEAFARAFEPAGFRREAFYPCYGLAEATLIVSGGRWEGPVTAGQVLGGQRVAIVAEGRETAGTGEVWVRGPSVADGYWGRPHDPAFDGWLGQEGPFLRTGDLGHFQGEQLVIDGRLKDLLIVDGRNLYPQDLELTATQAHPALADQPAAAFAVEGPEGELVVLVVEAPRHAPAGGWDEVRSAVRKAVTAEHEVSPAAVRLTTPGALPRTTSGKVRRGACREAYLAGGLAEVGLPAGPGSPTAAP